MKRVLSLMLSAVVGLSGMVGFAEEKAMTTMKPILISAPLGIEVRLDDAVIESDVDASVIDGVLMLPLKAVAESLGYKVTWNGETRTVEMLQGVRWTSVKIGENSYFKNKMAPQPLSAAPRIVSGRTMVPAEFFVEMLGHDLTVEDGTVIFFGEETSSLEPSIHRGYIHDIAVRDDGWNTITITSVEGSDDMMHHTVLHTSPQTTYFQREVKVGDFISAASAQVMTMSIPGQTSAYIVY